jgi:DNA-binding response OmpR family regulator
MKSNGRYQILIVDDNQELAELMKVLLEQNEFRTEYITDSTIAFNKIKTDQPNLVILDLLMPNLDGLRLCKNIKSTSEISKTKVIIYSGKNYDSDRRKALELGADAFFVKPTKSTILLDKIKELLYIA